ncbi:MULTISPECIES: ferritin-like domain-containing protein [Niastella]|uniref:PA2169 family four-helix-bundle protein n=1 Tax=Niastella soli TaxID=2821487 RepID=A0ABS3YN30_9BACT|nr:PA2169 family four-helix-bundle protein [Niastella soli]MBO9199293.1 PA2169 family four-helix-bundle protein [Niastella soli]
MTTNKDVIEVLNDLIRINNDRTAGYMRAAEDTKNVDIDLRTIFERMADDSRQNAIELTAQVGRLGGEPATGTTTTGKVYRAWMNVKDMFTGKDRHALLASCEYGEDAAQRAYEDALASDAPLATDVRQLITSQKSSLRNAHDMIKKYRDMHEITK